MGADNLGILRDLGFAPAGSWFLDNGRPAPDLNGGRSDKEALYAFVKGGDVVFLGREREAFGGKVGDGNEPLGLVRRYATENDRKLIEALMSGEPIEILAFTPSEPVTDRGWRVNVGAGLLDALLERLHPAWNGNGGAPKSRAPF